MWCSKKTLDDLAAEVKKIREEFDAHIKLHACIKGKHEWVLDDEYITNYGYKMSNKPYMRCKSCYVKKENKNAN